MTYDKQLPPVRYLLSLAKDVHFPATSEELLLAAEWWGFPEIVLDFLDLFHSDELFESRSEFMNRCEEMELLITQELESPREVMHSAQD